MPAWAVRVNVIWFAALICSLFSASLAILVKQWFREYLNWNCTATEERLRIRHVRYTAMVRWRVFEIAALLPLLLQFSLLMFFAGLSVLLKALNFTVWLTSTILIGCWFSLYLTTLLAPAFSSRCPYKTPLFDHWMQMFRGFCIRALYGKHWKGKLKFSNYYYRFPGDERGVRRDSDLDHQAIISADATLGDNYILSQHIQSCLENVDGEAIVIIVRNLIANRLDYPVESLSQSLELELIPTQGLSAVLEILHTAVDNRLQSPSSNHLQSPPSNIPPWVFEAVSCLAAIVKNAQVYRRPIDKQKCFILFSTIMTRGPEAAEELVKSLSDHFPLIQWRFDKVADHSSSEYNGVSFLHQPFYPNPTNAM